MVHTISAQCMAAVNGIHFSVDRRAEKTAGIPQIRRLRLLGTASVPSADRHYLHLTVPSDYPVLSPNTPSVD